MRKALFLYADLLIGVVFFANQVVSQDAQSSPIVLAISDIIEVGSVFKGGNVGPEIIGSFREQVTSDLVEKYNCHIVTRSGLYNVSVEDAINQLSSIDNAIAASNTILAVDYAVRASFSQSTMNDKTYRGFIFYEDIKNSSNNQSSTTNTFNTGSVHEICQGMTLEIARLLSLSKKTAKLSADNTNLFVWAVLPFARWDEFKTSRPTGEEDMLVLEAELILQKSGRIKSLVDHKRIDEILKEMKVTRMTGISSGLACDVARISGAERILMGTVARAGKGLRVDLHLIDPRTLFVLDARGKLCNTTVQLPEVVGQMTGELAQYSSPVPDVPVSSAEQRAREAEFYLYINQKKYPHMWDMNGLPYYPYDSMAVAVLQNAEAAYLLAKDNPTLAYKAAWSMSNLLQIHHFVGFPSYSKNITGRTAYVVDKILQTIKPDDPALKSTAVAGYNLDCPAPLLLRGEVLGFLGKYPDALKLAQEHLDRFPSIETTRANILKAKCTYKHGDPKGALAILDGIPVTSRERKSKISDLRVEIANAGNDEQKQYELLKAKVEAEDIMTLEIYSRFFKLQRKFEKPPDALKQMQKWMDKNYRITDTCDYNLLLEYAKCHESAGDKPQAARTYKEIMKIVDTYYLPVSGGNRYRSAFDTASNLLSKIESEIGPVSESWKTPGEILAVPAKYSIYIIPVADDETKITVNAATKLSSLLGANVKILPCVPIPQDAIQKGLYTCLPQQLLDGTLNASLIPDDAVFVAVITREGLKTFLRVVFSSNAGNPALFSYRPYWNENKASANYTASMILARSLMQVFHHNIAPIGHENKFLPYRAKWCEHYPCLYSKYSEGLLGAKQLLALCPSCQEEYKKVDFEKIHNDLMDYLKKAGAKIVKVGK